LGCREDKEEVTTQKDCRKREDVFGNVLNNFYVNNGQYARADLYEGIKDKV
jgi:hypothetical protein